jgi:hypothetical protein
MTVDPGGTCMEPMREITVEHQIAGYKKQIRSMQVALERKNSALDALMFVWCSGGCDRGVFRWQEREVTEELVLEAENNTKRLRQWFENHKLKQKRNPNV